VASARTWGMNAYSKDLRLRVLEAVGRGVPRKEVANLFGVSLSTIKRYIKRCRAGEDLEPRPSTWRKRRILSTSEEKRELWEQLEKNDEATLERPCDLWEQKRGVMVSIATMSRAIREKPGWTLKKDCEYCDHGARNVSPCWSDPKKRGLRAFPAIRRPVRRASRRHRSESGVTS
jgi:transposase